MLKQVRAMVWALGVAVAASAVAAPAAHAVQASGSILLLPSKQTGIVEAEEITVQVYFQNTSSTTPNLAVAPALSILPNPATLTGPISIDLSSTDCGGIANSTALAFVPGPASGCVAKNAGVSSCAAGIAGEVLINLGPAGIDAPDDTPVFLATIRLKNTIVAPLELPRLNLRASTGTCAVRSCLTPIPPTDCVSCAAEGCTFVAGTTTNEILRCKHSCLNRVEFNPNPNKFIFQGVVISPGYDPATQPFSISIGLAGQAPVLTIAVPNVPQIGPRAWRVLNGPNFERIQIQQQTGAGCLDSFRVAVDGFSNALAALKLAGNPMITVEITTGGQTFSNTESWETIIQGGNITKLQNDFDNASSC